MKSRKNKSRKNKTRKVYGMDRYNKYTIHKCTLISFNPVKSCNELIKVFGNKMSNIQIPPDITLQKRGIRWVRFKYGGKAEFHFVPPFTLKDDKALKRLAKSREELNPLKSQLFENHVGLYVPDLTPIIINCLKHNIRCLLNKREDGMYQFYFNIYGCLDYLNVDSLKIDHNKLHLVDPDFRAYSFKENEQNVHKFEKKFITRAKTRKNTKSQLYVDPKHNSAPRRITFHKNGKIRITGRDTPHGKSWIVSGNLDKNKNAILDFSKKGGPNNIKAKITSKGVKFNDGNSWIAVYNIS
jgi:hypothetical protein